eukprot:7362334-Lingulodinium_polyedra.AAC.1
MRRHLRAALYDTDRRRDESYSQYVARRETQFAQARRHGVWLPETALGLMLEEGADLSAQG